jgi:hypothetical protein
MAAAVPIVPAPVPPPSLFTFVGDAPHWLTVMGSDPRVFTPADSVFAAATPCIPWVSVPAAPAAPTHLTCAYSDLEGLLHSCLRADEAALLNSAPTLRYTLPSKLSAVWDALVEQGFFDITQPRVHMSVLAADLLSAAAIASDDARLELVLADTRSVELRPGAIRVISDWSDTILTSLLQCEGDDSLRLEGLLMRSAAPRFMAGTANVGGRYSAHSPLRKLMEVARSHVAADPMLAPELKLTNSCLDLLALPVAQFWKEMLLPPQLVRFPVGPQANLLEVVATRNLVFGNPEAQRRSVAGRLKEALLHFPSLAEVLVDQGFQPPQQLLSLLEQLSNALLPGTNCLLVSSWGMLEHLMAAVAPDRLAVVLSPDSAASRVQFHCNATVKEAASVKLQSKEALSGGASSTRYAGVKSADFKAACLLLAPLLADPGTQYTFVYQTVIMSGSRLLFMYLMGLAETVPGQDVMTSLSIFKGRMADYLGWCLAVDDLGCVPARGRDKRVEEGTLKALWSGDFAGTLQLQNLSKTWEQALAGRNYQSLPASELYLDPLDLRALLKFGARLFSGIRRQGSGIGSFTWVVQTALDLLLSKPSATCDPADIDELVQWWMNAALSEAGRLFTAELRKDADFSCPLPDVFLSRDANCITTLKERQDAHASFDQWSSTMPHTLRHLLPANNTLVAPGAGPVIVVSRAVLVPARAAVVSGAAVPGAPTQQQLALPAPAAAATAAATAAALATPPAALAKVVVGSHQHHIKRADLQGKVHKAQSKNTHIWLGKRKCKITDLEGHFGSTVCLASLMSSCNGRARFSVCDLGPLSTTPHPDHDTLTSAAHKLPTMYRGALKQYFC